MKKERCLEVLIQGKTLTRVTTTSFDILNGVRVEKINPTDESVDFVSTKSSLMARIRFKDITNVQS